MKPYPSYHDCRDTLVSLLVGLALLKKLSIISTGVYDEAYTDISTQYFFKSGVFHGAVCPLLTSEVEQCLQNG